ncbi:MAG TPA: long-chain fatty acid--CoA ligase [Blastocatellia bacterium]|nr:long-chain fatty acid--CoA ligase [Blastocatellia bacterium]
MMGDEPKTLNELFNFAVERRRESELMRFKSGGEWKSLSYGEAARRVRELALGLYALGLRKGDRVAIWSENRPEWNIADLASLALGAVDVPIYTTQSRRHVEYILSDSASRAIFVSAPFLADALTVKENVPSIEWVILFDDSSPAGNAGPVVHAEGLIDRGRALYGEQPALYETLWRDAGPDELATLLYTSGTTGEPKGVMLTHKNLTSNAINSCRWLDLDGRRDVALTYLPFSHIFERGVIYLYIHIGTVIAYAESIDTVAQNLAEVHPTVMTSVPRMFEKIYAKIVERGLGARFPRKQIFLWSLDVGKQWAMKKDQGRPVGIWLSIQHAIADTLVFKKWRESLGGRIRAMISGGAALAPDIAYRFAGAGLPILEGYGLTETSPSISCNTESRNRIGTVGPVIDGVRVEIADDGEILVKGDTVMKGYYNRPDDDAQAFTPDGWFRTGDVGYVDHEGFLVITDRKKELIKTSGGKYIAPQQIESLIKSSRFVSQVVVVGNGRKFPAALIVPNMEMLQNYAAMKGIDYSSNADLIEDPRIVDLIQRQVDKCTTQLARFETIKKVALLQHELTTEGGEMTPTLKPRRSVIEKKYSEIIDRLYEEESRELVAV